MEPRAHIWLYIYELDLEVRFDIHTEDPNSDIFNEIVTSMVAMIPVVKQRVENPEASYPESGVVRSH